ncbi:MAG: response regulator [Vampirovibrionales bacterium]
MRSIRILIVDDSAVMRQIAITALHSRLGVDSITTAEAANGKDALTWLANNEPVDVILMDWNMPELSGLECVKAIRSKGDATPIVMVTTEGESSQVVAAIQAGANHYVLKPFNAEALCERILAVLAMDNP